MSACAFHHRVKHQTAWTPTLHTDGRVDWISPTGRKYTTYPINRQAPPRATSQQPKNRAEQASAANRRTSGGRSAAAP